MHEYVYFGPRNRQSATKYIIKYSACSVVANFVVHNIKYTERKLKAEFFGGSIIKFDRVYAFFLRTIEILASYKNG